MTTTGCLPSLGCVVVPFFVMSLTSMHVTSKWVNHNRKNFEQILLSRHHTADDEGTLTGPWQSTLDLLSICEWFGVSEGCVPARREKFWGIMCKSSSFSGSKTYILEYSNFQVLLIVWMPVFNHLRAFDWIRKRICPYFISKNSDAYTSQQCKMRNTVEPVIIEFRRYLITTIWVVTSQQSGCMTSTNRLKALSTESLRYFETSGWTTGGSSTASSAPVDTCFSPKAIQ